MPTITTSKLYLGCDPELFLVKNGKVIGSEKVVPNDALGYGTVIQDGVQVEFNPAPDTCRQMLASKIGKCFNTLSENMPHGVSVSMDVTVDVDKAELASLQPKNRVLGCNSSLNIYNPEATIGVRDASKFLKRSAGGHIHLGFLRSFGAVTLMEKTLKSPELVVPVLDLLVGNTMVLLDRDPGNAVRRKTYGRAGEYRQPSHGLEYRTLSNFWLRHYVLMSFTFGLVRQAVRLAASHSAENDTLTELMAAVKTKDVIRAINNNDAKLAAKNFEKIAPIIAKLFPGCTWALNKHNLRAFRHLVNVGADHYFHEEPVAHWKNLSGLYTNGWEMFVENELKPDMKRVEGARKPFAIRLPSFATA